MKRVHEGVAIAGIAIVAFELAKPRRVAAAAIARMATADFEAIEPTRFATSVVAAALGTARTATSIEWWVGRGPTGRHGHPDRQRQQ